MKKILLFSLSFLTLSFAARSQSFTNGGFEAWQGPSGTFVQTENPSSWYGSDKLLADNYILLQVAGVTPVPQVIKSTDAHSGTYAAELKTAFLGDTVGNVPGALFNARVSIDLISILSNPNIDISNILSLITYSGGTPILGRKVDSVNAWVKLTDQNADNGVVFITAMQKSQTSTGVDTMIAIGAGTQLVLNNVSNDYRQISVPMVYADANNTATDTLLVVFSSSVADSVATPTDGNTMYVDDVTLYTSQGSGTTSIRQPLLNEDIALVYPNPATDMVYFNLNTNQRAETYRLTVFDVTGRTVLQQQLHQAINEQDVKGWTKGSYYYVLTNGSKTVKGKFVVQ